MIAEALGLASELAPCCIASLAHPHISCLALAQAPDGTAASAHRDKIQRVFAPASALAHCGIVALAHYDTACDIHTRSILARSWSSTFPRSSSRSWSRSLCYMLSHKWWSTPACTRFDRCPCIASHMPSRTCPCIQSCTRSCTWLNISPRSWCCTWADKLSHRWSYTPSRKLSCILVRTRGRAGGWLNPPLPGRSSPQTGQLHPTTTWWWW